LLSIDEIIRQWEKWDSLLEQFHDEDGPYTSDPDEGVKNSWWNPLWVPFTHDGSGNHICIDLDPDTKGTWGQVIQMWHDSGYRQLYANSFTAWLDDYIKGLETGKFVYAKDWGLVDKDSPFNES
jgi:cell wall assembly regulator SMI1